MELENICDTSCGYMRDLGMEVPRERIILKSQQSASYEENRRDEMLSGIGIQEFLPLFHYLYNKAEVTSGTTKPFLQDGKVNYEICIMDMPCYKDESYGRLLPLSIMVHELTHVWQLENTPSGMAGLPILIRCNEAKSNLDSRLGQYYDLMDAVNGYSQHRQGILTDEALKQFMVFQYQLGMTAIKSALLNAEILNFPREREGMNTLMERLMLERRSYLPAAERQARLEAAQRLNLKENQEHENQRIEANMIQRLALKIQPTYSEVCDLASSYLSLNEKSARHAAQTKLLSEGLSEYISRVAADAYRRQNNLGHIPLDSKEMIEKLEDRLNSLGPEDSYLRYGIRNQLSYLRIRSPAMAPYELGLEIFRRFPDPSYALKAAMVCNDDKELLAIFAPQEATPERGHGGIRSGENKVDRCDGERAESPEEPDAVNFISMGKVAMKRYQTGMFKGRPKELVAKAQIIKR